MIGQAVKVAAEVSEGSGALQVQPADSSPVEEMIQMHSQPHETGGGEVLRGAPVNLSNGLLRSLKFRRFVEISIDGRARGKIEISPWLSRLSISHRIGGI